MDLSATDIQRLPLFAALMNRNGDTLAATPEWTEPLIGSIAYPVRRSILVVNPTDPIGLALPAARLLIDLLDEAPTMIEGKDADLVKMLAASLHLVMGSPSYETASLRDVLEIAKAGIEVRTDLEVVIRECTDAEITNPYALALILVQLAVNARVHADAEWVELRCPLPQLAEVVWPGTRAVRGRITNRLHDERQGWGMGFSLIAADSIGARVHIPQRIENGLSVSSVALGYRDLALPLALVKEGYVVRMTDSWVEETMCGFRTKITDQRLLRAMEGASRTPGEVVSTHGRFARVTGDSFWLAIPPDGIPNRVRDLLHGVAHERALWANIPQPYPASITALAEIASRLSGSPWERFAAGTWEREFPRACQNMGVKAEPIELDGLSAPDPQVCAFLLGEFGTQIRPEGNGVVITVKDPQQPILQALGVDNNELRVA